MIPIHNLYGSQASLYTARTRAYLRFKKIPYQEVLTTRELRERLLIPRVGRSVIPVVITPDNETLQDSTVIQDVLEARFPKPSIYPPGPKQRLVALLLEAYGNEWLRLPALYYRWSFPEANNAFLFAEFGRSAAPTMHPSLQPAAGEKASALFSSRLADFGITARTAAPIEAWTEGFLKEFDAHLGQHPFLLGTRPCVGDFGLIGPLYAHLWRDPYSGAMMRRICPNVCAWVERMNAADNPQGSFLPDDAVPDTLAPMLCRVFEEFMPVAIDTGVHVARWVDSHSEQQMPWCFGSQRFSIGGVEEDRMVWSSVQWMAQRAIDFYSKQSAGARAELDRFFTPLGGSSAVWGGFPVRLDFENFRLVAR